MENRELVTLGEILNTNQYESISSPLALALGKNISGVPVVTDLDKMPSLIGCWHDGIRKISCIKCNDTKLTLQINCIRSADDND